MDWNNKETKLSKAQAIHLIDKITNEDDPYWSDIVEDFYDEKSDSWPTIYQVFSALGITEEEYRQANGVYQNIDYPEVQSEMMTLKDQIEEIIRQAYFIGLNDGKDITKSISVNFKKDRVKQIALDIKTQLSNDQLKPFDYEKL